MLYFGEGMVRAMKKLLLFSVCLASFCSTARADFNWSWFKKTAAPAKAESSPGDARADKSKSPARRRLPVAVQPPTTADPVRPAIVIEPTATPEKTSAVVKDSNVEKAQLVLIPSPPTPVMQTPPLNPYAPLNQSIEQQLQAEEVIAPPPAATILSGDTFKPIGNVSAVIDAPPGDYPTDYATARFEALPTTVHYAGIQREWTPHSFTWEAPSVHHRPLYFEESMLERNGHTAGPLVQPVLSATYFFTRFPMMPYLTSLDRPHASIYTLGHYRPGSHAPLVKESIPFRAWPTLAQAGLTAGIYLIFP